MVTTCCQWILPLVANLADNLEGRQNYQRAKWRHFQDCNILKFLNYCSVYWVPELKFLWNLLKLQSYWVLANPVSICSYNGAVENDDLLSLFTTNRKLPMATAIRSEFSDNGNQWQPTVPMVPLVKLWTHGWFEANCMVKSTFFLMNVFIALKGSHFWFYIWNVSLVSLLCTYRQRGVLCI